MSLYKIHRWDVVMFGNSSTRVPMIYVKPDLTFLDFIRSNNYTVMCEINGTGTIYDGKQIPGVVDKSSFIPNCRPNFYEKTGYYVITLWSNWYGYPNPNNLGFVKFSGLNASIDTSYSESVTNDMNENTEDSQPEIHYNMRNLKKTEILLLIFGIMIILAVLIILHQALLRKRMR